VVKMNFEEQVGGSLFVYFIIPFRVDENRPPLNCLAGILLGVEPSGIWMESATLDARFEQCLWERELREGGTEAVGTTSLCCFVPFQNVAMAMACRAKSEKEP